MCGSTTTTSVKTGTMSSRGDTYDSIYWEMLNDSLKENGNYEVSSVEKTKYEDQPKFDSLSAQLNDLDSQIAKAQADGQPGRVSQLQAQRSNIAEQISNLKSTTYTDVDLKKKEDLRVQQAIATYGEGSPQVTEARAQVQKEQVQKVEGMAHVETNFLNNLQKFTSGDYSYTQDQYNQISKFIEPIRDVIMKTSNDLLAQYGQDDTMLRSELSKVSAEIDKTGFAVSDALDAARVQMEQSGATLMDTLKQVNESSFAKAKFQFDLLSDKADQQAAQQAAMLGLPPGSQAERIAAAKVKNDALKQIELDLAQQTAKGTLDIQAGVEQGKQQISLDRVNLAATQGSKKEGVANQGFGLTNLLTQKIDQAVGQKGNALINAEQQRQQMLYGAAYGNLAGEIQAGQQGMAFETAQKQAAQSMDAQLMGQVAQQLGVEQQRSFAETTTTKKQNKGFLDAFTDILGAGASVAGAAFGMGGGGGGSKSSSSGGGGPSTFMPVMDYSTYNAAAAPRFSLDWQNS